MNQRGSQPVNRYNLRSSSSRIQQVSDLPQATQTTTASQVFQPPVTLIRSQSHSQLTTQFHAHLHSPLQTTFVTQGPRLSSSTGSIPVSGQQHFSGSTLQDHLKKYNRIKLARPFTSTTSLTTKPVINPTTATILDPILKTCPHHRRYSVLLYHLLLVLFYSEVPRIHSAQSVQTQTRIPSCLLQPWLL